MWYDSVQAVFRTRVDRLLALALEHNIYTEYSCTAQLRRVKVHPLLIGMSRNRFHRFMWGATFESTLALLQLESVALTA